jgi:hypothetical protein
MSAPTVTFAVAPTTPAGPAALIVVDPDPTPVTAILTLLAFAGIVADGATVATAGLSEVRLTLTADGVIAERFNVTFCELPLPTEMSCGEKVRTAVTLTGAVDEV